MEIMSPDILIVRDSDCYRVLHGHLHLANVLSTSSEVIVDVRGEGKVKIIKTRNGLLVNWDSQRLPLLGN
jgi:hypothetical protein